MQGSTRGRPNQPDVRLTLDRDEELLAPFGFVDTVVSSLGFFSSKSRIYGPWGTSLGREFQFQRRGAIRGFFGRVQNGSLAGVGVFVDDIA